MSYFLKGVKSVMYVFQNILSQTAQEVTHLTNDSVYISPAL